MEQTGVDSSVMLPYLSHKFGLNYFTASNTDDVDDALVCGGFVYVPLEMQRLANETKLTKYLTLLLKMLL